MSAIEQMAAQQAAQALGALGSLANAANLGARAYKDFQIGEKVLFRAPGNNFKEGIILKKAGEMYLVQFKGWFREKSEWVEWYSIKGVLEP